MKKRVWVISVDMGYGHQRAAYPFLDMAQERIITANDDRIISQKERMRWARTQRLYEFLSRISTLPLGKALFGFYDWLQKIKPLYPLRDLSSPSLSSLYANHLVRKGVGNEVVKYTQKEPLSILTPFFLTALAADHCKIKKIFCIVTDTDINRVWVSNKPTQSNITYLAPTERVYARLVEYGVPEKNIVLTGFPLPEELIKTLELDLANRIVNLDPEQNFRNKMKPFFTDFSGKKTHPFTVTYAVGGAGAQTTIAKKALLSLVALIKKKELKFIVSCGIHLDIAEEFKAILKKEGLAKSQYVKIHVSISKLEYFRSFSQVLRTTDVLWTKPSELSFYCALGIPIIIAPPIGAHEMYNLRWLLELGGGLLMDHPESVGEWIMDWRRRGILAKAAMNGYLFAEHNGTEHIKEVLNKN